MPVPGWDVPHDYYAPDEEQEVLMDEEDLIHQLNDLMDNAHEAGVPRYRIRVVLQRALDNFDSD